MHFGTCDSHTDFQVKSQSHGAKAYCGGHLAAQLVKRQMTRKWYKIELQLLWLINRVIRCLSNGAILNDLDGPQTQISRSGHYLTLNISKMSADTAIVTMESE